MSNPVLNAGEDCCILRYGLLHIVIETAGKEDRYYQREMANKNGDIVKW